MRRTNGVTVMFAVLAASLPVAASAQSAQSASSSGVGGTPARSSSPINMSPVESQNTPGEELRPAANLPTQPTVTTGLFPDLGNQLLNDGIDIHGTILDRALNNAGVGNTLGNTPNLAIFRPTVDIDLGRLAGIQGGILHGSLTWWFSKNDEPGAIAQLGGAQDGYQVTPILEASTLTRLTYEQLLLKGKLDVEIGKANVHQYFFIPNSLDPFTYDSTVLYVNTDFNSIPYAEWMGKATYKLTPAWYLQGGIFTDDYDRLVRNGWNFGDKDATGVEIIDEVGYRTSFATEVYPANLEAGFVWDTRTGYGNVKGTGNLASALNTAADYPGGGVVVFQGAKVISRGPARPGGPPANLQLYSQLDVAVDKPQPFDLDASVGANLTGLLAIRPNDILGLQLRYARLSAVEAAFETREHTLLNRGKFVGLQARDGIELEASYQIQVTRYATLSLYGEYFDNPDDYEVPFVNHLPSNGLAAGTLLRIPLGPALGTSAKPF